MCARICEWRESGGAVRTICDEASGEGEAADLLVSCSLEHTDAVAVEMICRLVSGAAAEDELGAAKEWRDMNPDHAQAFARISHAWTLIKPAGAAWKRKQRARRLASALVEVRARLLGFRPGRLLGRSPGLQGQAARKLALWHGGLP